MLNKRRKINARNKMNTHIFFILNVYFLLLTLSVRKIHPFNSHTKKKKQGINIELCVVAKTRFN